MSLYKLSNGTKIREGNPFTFDDIQYPANWLNLATAEDLLDRGITIVMEAVRPDERFYNIVENEDGTLTITPHDLDRKKAEMIARVKEIAGNILSNTDWMVVRSWETGKPVGGVASGYRALVRVESDAQESSIESAQDIDSLAALSFEWPKAPWEKSNL